MNHSRFVCGALLSIMYGLRNCMWKGNDNTRISFRLNIKVYINMCAMWGEVPIRLVDFCVQFQLYLDFF